MKCGLLSEGDGQMRASHSALQSARPAASAISNMAAPGRMERPATMWSRRGASAGAVSCALSLRGGAAWLVCWRCMGAWVHASSWGRQ